MDIKRNQLKQIKKRNKKKLAIKSKIKLKSNKLRLVVYKSCKNFYAQIVDDVNHKTICSSSTMEKGFQSDVNVFRCNKKNARVVGEKIAKKALDKNISEVVFDRNAYMYHGVIKEFADSCRNQGLIF